MHAWHCTDYRLKLFNFYVAQLLGLLDYFIDQSYEEDH